MVASSTGGGRAIATARRRLSSDAARPALNVQAQNVDA